jgi:hypothetical protein
MAAGTEARASEAVFDARRSETPIQACRSTVGAAMYFGLDTQLVVSTLLATTRA